MEGGNHCNEMMTWHDFLMLGCNAVEAEAEVFFFFFFA